jgi:hypothetical protein
MSKLYSLSAVICDPPVTGAAGGSKEGAIRKPITPAACHVVYLGTGSCAGIHSYLALRVIGDICRPKQVVLLHLLLHFGGTMVNGLHFSNSGFW